MQESRKASWWLKNAVKIGVPVLLTTLLLFLFRKVVADLTILVFGSSAIAFLTEPLARFYERKLNRNHAALAALVSLVGALLAFLWLLLPSLIAEAAHLAETLPQSIAMIREWLSQAAQWLEIHLPGVRLPAPSLNAPLPAIAAETITIASSVADVFYKLSLMIVLSFFLLCDRARLMIRLELLAPSSMRRMLVRMGNAVCRELKLYLRGQGMIAASVGTLAAIGLTLAGVRSSLILGMIVGILNMIPYFGPILGGIPVVLTALGSGWQTGLTAIFVLWLVQQADSALISPRIMSGLAGISPATVLVAVFVGSGLGGIVGMLLALPLLMTFRTVYRVFVQRHENV